MNYDSPETGFKVQADDNGKKIHTILVREGCDGSPTCAMEWYISNTTDYLGPGFNVHFSDREMDALYKAVKAVRKARKNRQALPDSVLYYGDGTQE